MSAPYNLTLIANANGWTDYMLVFNYWTEGIWFTGIIFSLALIIFTVAKYNLVPTPEASASACFFGFFTSALLWIFMYEGSHAIYTVVPVGFAFGLSWAIYHIYANK